MSPKRVKQVEDMNDEVRRLKINERERRRMHDLNSAMDGLRSAMPYARGQPQKNIIIFRCNLCVMTFI